MNTFGLDKNYNQLNFEEISVDKLEIISGGTGVANVNDGLATTWYSGRPTTGNGYTEGSSSRTSSTYTQYYSYSYPSSSGTLTNTSTGSTFG